MADGSSTGCTAVQLGCSRAISTFFEYETPRVVHIHSRRVGIIQRLIQITIIVYIALCVIWTKKGYQEVDYAISATTTKLKGVSVINYSRLNITIPGGFHGSRVWDTADYVIPPQENDALFLMTNVIVTPGQRQGQCPEDPSLAPCQEHSDCPVDAHVVSGNARPLAMLYNRL
jgi:hypothetical protein